MDLSRIIIPWFITWVVGTFSTVHSIDHGTNLIWAQGPRTRILSLSRLVGIPGDPEEWVKSKSPHVHFISAPHFTWVFTSLGFHYDDQSLYWSEKMHRKIQGLTLNGSTETNTLFIGTSPEVNGMTVDWMSRNLYFTDSLYDWIMMISSRPGQSYYRIVVNEGLTSPHGIAVHPSAGRLFWSDCGSAPKIESSDLLGQDRRLVIQAKDLTQPKGLVIDFANDRLYWVDASKATIESVAFDGSNRVIFETKEPKSSFYGLALHGDYFFVTDRGRQGNLQVFNPKEKQVKFKLSNFPYDIIMYDKTQQPGESSECDDKSCDQLCVLDPFIGATCVCAEGYILNTTDNVTCIPSKKFVHPIHIYAIGDSVCQYPANMADMALHNVSLDSQCFLSERQGYMSLAYDARNNMLFYFANRTKTISRIPLESKGVGKVIAGGAGEVNGLSYDWIHGNLYWADTTRGIIHICARDCSYQTAVIERQAQPFGIAVHPERGEIYWTNQGHLPDVAPSIRKAYMDGSKMEVIMGDNLRVPTHIYMDHREDKMYWADSFMNHVRRYDLNTKRISIVFQLPGVNFYGISIFKDYILWTDRNDQNGMHAARMDTKEKVRGIIHPKDGLASDLITFDPLNQPIKNKSAIFENPCAQIYLKQGVNSYRCACGNGYVPLADIKSQCISNPVWNDFILVNDAYQRQIFQVDLKTGDVHGLKIKPVSEPIALAFNPNDYKVFWSNNKEHVIKSMNIWAMVEETVMIMSNKSMCDGLAVDYINQMLYYTDAGLDMIGAISLLNYDMRTTIIGEDLGEPRDLVVSSAEGMLYWSDWGSKPRIERAYLDGSARDVLVAFNHTAWPNGLALDAKENMLYWADAHTDTISVINLVTRKITPLIEEPGSHYFSMEVISDYLYVSDWTRNYLVRMNKRGGSMKRFGNSRFTKMYAIQGFNSTEMAKVNSVCAISGCDHMCLPAGRLDYTCRCSDGYTSNNGNCVPKTTMVPNIIVTDSNDTSFSSIILNYPSTTPYPVPPSLPSSPSTSSSSPTSSSTSSSPLPPSSSPSSTSTVSIPTSTIPPASSQSTQHPVVVISDSTTSRISFISSSPLTDTEAPSTRAGIDTTITSTKRSTKSTSKGNLDVNAGKTGKTTLKGSAGLSPSLIGAIVGAVLLVIIVAVIVAVIFKRRNKSRSGHWKLRDDSSMSDSKVVFHDPHSDSISFESGIANPTYDYLHNIPPIDSSDLNGDDFGLDL